MATSSPHRRVGRPRRSDDPMSIDVQIGRRIRLRRTLLGLSQQTLAAEVGLSFQQVQKYEKGTNRLGASRLFQIAEALGVSVADFFEDTERDGTACHDPALPAAGRSKTVLRRETLELVRAYYSIPAGPLRAQFFTMVETAADHFAGRD